MRRRLNIKLLVALIVATTLLVGSVHLVHGVQANRNAGVLLKHADQAEKKGEHAEAAKYLVRYLTFRPNDHEALARYGLLLASSPAAGKASPQTLLVLERALALSPDRDDVRRQAAELAFTLGRPKEASEHAITLLLKPGQGTQDRQRLEKQLLESFARPPEAGPLTSLKQLIARPDATMEDLLGRCLEEQGKTGRRDEAEDLYRKAATCYRLAIAQAPDRIETYGRLAELLREQLSNPAQADRVMDAASLQDGIIAKNPESFRAFLLRAQYRKKHGLPGGADDVAQAQKLAPKEADVLVAAAESALGSGDLETARKLLQDGETAYPKDDRFYLARMTVEVQGQKIDAATAALRRGLKVLPDQLDLLWNLADLLIQTGQLGDAAKEIERLRKRDDLPTAPLDYLEARLLVAKGRWPEAIRMLEKARALMAGTPALNGLTKKSDLLLAQGYKQLGLPEQQLAVSRRALAIDPGSTPARLEQAEALLALGRLDEAIEGYRNISPQTPAVQTVLAQLLLTRNLRMPAKQQSDPARWQELETLVGQIEKATPGRLETLLLKSEILTTRGRLDEARRQLEEAKNAHPKRIEPWIALALISEQEGKADEALSQLDQAERQLGDRVELRLARVSYWGRRGGDEAQKHLDALAQTFRKGQPNERLQEENALASAYFRIGNLKEAEQAWTNIVEQKPDDRNAVSRLLELALMQRNDDLIRQSADRLRRIEGEDGVLWRYADATRLVLQAKPRDQKSLDKAKQILAEVSKKRPGWSLASILEAEIAEREGKPNRAIESYLKAIREGDRRPQTIRRAVQWLNGRGRTSEAERLITELLENSPPNGVLGQLAAELSLRKQDQSQAVSLARQAVSTDSKNFHDHLWLAQVLWAAKKPTEAEAELRRAVAMASNEPDVWLALVNFLAGTDQKEAAEKAIAEARTKLPPDLVPLTLARCLERLGDRAKAEGEYRTALDARPNDPATLLSVANFFLGSQRPEVAVPLLRRILDSKSKPAREIVVSARRSLAMCLANGDGPSFLEATTVLDQNLSEEGGLLEDQRFKALLLASRKGRRREAIANYEELARRSAPTALERLLLAQLYAADRHWPKARELFMGLVSEDEQNPDYLNGLARVLLAEGEVEEARPWVAKLEKVSPKSLPTLETKARLLHQEGKKADAVALLEARAKTDLKYAGALALLLENLGEKAAAERMNRAYAAESKEPEAVLVLAQFLGRERRVDEALDLCEGAWKTISPTTVSNTALRILEAGKPTDEQRRRVAKWIEDAIRKSPDEVRLKFDLANMHIFQGNYAEAEVLMRQIIADRPGNGGPLNNLAWLLAARGTKTDEALDLINRAISLDGANPQTLDTRGLVYLAMGRTTDALKDLDASVHDNPTPDSLFHLAQAQLRANRRSAAQETLRKAQAAGLDENAVTPLERDAFHKLVAALEK